MSAHPRASGVPRRGLAAARPGKAGRGTSQGSSSRGGCRDRSSDLSALREAPCLQHSRRADGPEGPSLQNTRSAPTSSELTRLRRWVARVTRKLEKHFGEPTLGRRPDDPLEVLIVTILSQNTNDELRDRAYERLRDKYPTYEGLLRAPVRSIASAIRTCGLHRQKSQRIKRVLLWTQERFGSLSLGGLCRMSTEEAFEALTSLNGVGPKTAAVVLLFGCGREIFPVDTHVHRTTRRIGLVPWKSTREQTFARMQPLVAEGKALSLHLNLIRLGRTICRAPRPRCGECFLVKDCRFPEKVPAQPSSAPR